MKNRFLVIAGLAMAVTAAAPSAARADCANGVGTVTTGFGGYFDGCWAGFDISRYFEKAGHVSDMYWFNGMPTRNTLGVNEPTSAPGTFLFNDDCGSAGGASQAGAFCTPIPTTITWGTNSELVFGLQKPAAGGNWWLYSGTDPNRNNPPVPAGVQNFLWQIQGGTYDGQYLFGWEDLNSGCLSAASSTGSVFVTGTQLLNGPTLQTLLANCQPYNHTGITQVSDDDYNDFYVIINPVTLGTPTEVVPEPMTMTLLATGLVGLGGASLKRRRNKK